MTITAAKIVGLATTTWMGSAMVAQAGNSSIEDTLKNAATQAPSLVVLVVLALFFLRAMQSKDAAFAEAQMKSRQDYLESLKGLMESHQRQWDALHADQLQERKEIHELIARQLDAMRIMSAAVATCPSKGHSIV